MTTTDPAVSLAARAEALIGLGRPADAVPLVHQALALLPDNPHLLDLLVQADVHVDPSRARATAERLKAVAPESHRGYLLASVADQLLKRRGEAAKQATRAIELAPNEPGCHVQLAHALIGKRFGAKRGRAAATAAIELAPDSAAGYIAMGNIELGRGKARKADRWYRKALEIDPGNSFAQGNIAIAGRAKGKLNDAFADVQSMLQLDPRDASARRILDDTVYATLVHMQWVVTALIILLRLLRGA